MNSYERKMTHILSQLVDKNGVVGIKTSFEDEGATFNEVIRLKEICNQSNTKINLKIGGPEAIRDIKDSLVIGVKGLVAPMVESAFGLKKFVDAVNKNIIDPCARDSLNLAINVETITAINNLDQILESECINQLYGITIGRSDLIASMGFEKKRINDEEVYKIVSDAFRKVKKNGLKAIMGGGIDIQSYDFVKELHKEGLLDRVETRYVMFDLSKCISQFENNLLKAQEFEFNWLNNKRQIYGQRSTIEESRIEMIGKRIKESFDKVGK